MVGGALLAVVLGELSRLLPIPKSLPMDKFFQNRQGAYLMMIFGVAIAPLAEEMLFRGFLYPVLDRWLQTLFMTPRQLRRGCIWVLIMAAWGYLEHRLPLAWSVLLAAVVFLVVGGLVVAQSLKSGERPSGLWLLPAATTVSWGLAAGAISNHAFGIATTVLLVLAILLRRVQHGAGAGHLGRRPVGPVAGRAGDQHRFCHGAQRTAGPGLGARCWCCSWSAWS